MIGGVFISYRREDSGGYAGRIFDRLTSRLGHDNVFFDVDAIAPGRDFVEVLSERVGKCDALLAIIGKHWVTSADGENRRRLDDPNDFVRIEIEAALKRNVPVIPVLVDGAAMPRADQLPDGLKALVRRQAIEISLTRFDSDADRLTGALAEIEEELPRAAEPASESTKVSVRADAGARANSSAATASRGNEESDVAPAAPSPGPSGRLPLVLAALALVLVAVAGGWFLTQRGSGAPSSAGASVAPSPAANGAGGPNSAPSAAPSGGLPAAASQASASQASVAKVDDWLTIPEFQREFEKQRIGFYPDSGLARCDGGVLKLRVHWSEKPAALEWAWFRLPEDAFASKNSTLADKGYGLQYDNIFKDCDGRTQHLALWTKKA